LIEVQIKEKELYERLKGQASYCSDLTQVCAFRDEMLEVLQESGVDVDHRYAKAIKPKEPVLTIVQKNVMKIVDGSAEMLYFCGVRSEYDPTISVRFMHEINLLLNAGLVKTDEKFREVYGKLGYRDKINALVCAKVKLQGKGKLVDFIDGELSLQSMKFPDVKEKEMLYKQMLVKVIRRPNDNSTDSSVVLEGDRYHEAFAVECTKEGVPIPNRMICLRFYNRPVILRSILYEGSKINIACRKITELHGDVLSTYDPLVIPNGLDLRKDVAYSPPNRSIPADLYRNALFEFQCRYNYTYGNDA
jgi:hypothetical protein